jgi:predicted RND superfamily exporter protein
VKTLVNFLANSVRKGPWIVVAVVLVATMILGSFASQFLPAEDQNESFAPDAPELTAATEIATTFGAASRMQVVVSSTTGDVITLEGLNAAFALEESVRSSDVAEYLIDQPQNPAILSYLFPVQVAIQSGQPIPTTDAEVKALYLEGLSATPPEFQGFLTALLSDDADLNAGTAELALSVITYESSDNFDELAARALAMADAVTAAPSGETITQEPFNVDLIFSDTDEFQTEISRLLMAAAMIILLVLAFIFLVAPKAGRERLVFMLGVALMVVGAGVAVAPGLAKIFPDVFPEAWGTAELLPVALSALGLYTVAFLMWALTSTRLRRTTADTLVTFLTIGLAIQWMSGYGYLRFGDQSQMVQILPILLIGLGVDYSIHWNTRYRQELSAGRSVDVAISTAIRTVGVALVLATLTTAVGFLTNVTSSIPALAEFGELAAVGIAASFVLMLTFVPAVRELLDRRQERQTEDMLVEPPFASTGAVGRLLKFDGVRGRTQWWGIWGIASLMLGGGAALMLIANGLDSTAPILIATVIALPLTVLGVWIWLANSVQRLRDRGKGAVWLLLVLIPVGGTVWYFVELGFMQGGFADASGQEIDASDLQASEARALPRIIGSFAVLPRRFAVATLVVSLGLATLGAFGMTKLSTEFSFLDFVPTTSPLRDTAVTVDERFDFPETTSVLVKGDLETGAGWNAMLASYSNGAGVENVSTIQLPSGAVFPVGQSLMSVMNQWLNPGGPQFDQNLFNLALAAGFGQDRTVPADADLTTLYDAAYDKDPITMESVLAGDYKSAVYNFDTIAGESGAGAIAEGLNAAFEPMGAIGGSAVTTSTFIINDLVVGTLSESQVSSLLLTMTAALLLLVINFWFESKRPMLGVITTVPVAIVVVWTFGIMAALGIPFGPVTATISALAIGIGIPYMIHVTHRYLEERLEQPGPDEAMKQTLVHTGGALAGSAVTTILGFGILVTSTTIPFRQFGFVTAYTILFALVAAVLVLPSMLVLWDRWHRNRGDEPFDRYAVTDALSREG